MSTDRMEAKGATKDHENRKGGKLNDHQATKNEGHGGAEERDNVAARQATNAKEN